MLDRLLLSYASHEDPVLRRLTIRAIERVTGQPHLKRLYLATRRQPRAGENFWDAAVRELRIGINYDPARLAAIPRAGPVVVVANHPFGVLDGVVLSHLIAKLRPDFKVLTHHALYRAAEVRPFVLPIAFAETPAATLTNLRSRASALELLAQGGCLIIFPSGAVSTAKTPFGREAIDCAWKPFAARAIMQTAATVVPVFFAGQNSRLFQVASHVSQTLRVSLLFHEVRNKVGRVVSVRIGGPIPYAGLARIGDRHALTDHLRRLTYGLADDPDGGPLHPAHRPRGRADARRTRARPAGAWRMRQPKSRGTAVSLSL
jgi:putative hemolysin